MRLGTPEAALPPAKKAPEPIYTSKAPLMGHGLSVPKQSDVVRNMSGCQRVMMEGEPVVLCVEAPPRWIPIADAMPGVLTAALGFWIVHKFSVRRQQRDEQFKLVLATRELLTTVAKEADGAWSKRTGRVVAGARLIHRVAAISSALSMIQLRNAKFDCTEQMVSFRQAVTNDFEAGSVAMIRRTAIAQAAAALEEAIMRNYIRIYG
jgi:hypothetical protein